MLPVLLACVADLICMAPPLNGRDFFKFRNPELTLGDLAVAVPLARVEVNYLPTCTLTSFGLSFALRVFPLETLL